MRTALRFESRSFEARGWEVWKKAVLRLATISGQSVFVISRVFTLGQSLDFAKTYILLLRQQWSKVSLLGRFSASHTGQSDKTSNDRAPEMVGLATLGCPLAVLLNFVKAATK